MTAMEEREYTPVVRGRDYSIITLERVVSTESPEGKHRTGKPNFRIGSLFEYTYKSKNHDQALQAAMKQLKFWGEDPLWWKEVK